MVRDRPDLPKLVETLMVLVADHTIAEEMLRKPDMEDLLVIILLGTADSAAVAANYLTGATILTQFSSRWKKMGAVGSAGERMWPLTSNPWQVGFMGDQNRTLFSPVNISGEIKNKY